MGDGEMGRWGDGVMGEKLIRLQRYFAFGYKMATSSRKTAKIARFM